jgi:hypothetical protein
MGQVSALLLLKPADAHGAMQLCRAQTSLTDIPATMMKLLGISSEYPGESIIDLDPIRDRKRMVIFVKDHSAREPVFEPWELRGSVYDSTSWHRLTQYKVEHRIQSYRWGSMVRFGVSGNGDGYLSSGWSKTSPALNWSNGSSAELVFGIDCPAGDVAVKIIFAPFIVAGKLDKQRIRTFINGEPAGELVCNSSKKKLMTFTVPREILQGDRMVFVFEFPDAKSPAELGESHDSRKLCMGLYQFQAELVPADRPPAQ